MNISTVQSAQRNRSLPPTNTVYVIAHGDLTGRDGTALATRDVEGLPCWSDFGVARRQASAILRACAEEGESVAAVTIIAADEYWPSLADPAGSVRHRVAAIIRRPLEKSEPGPSTGARPRRFPPHMRGGAR